MCVYIYIHTHLCIYTVTPLWIPNVTEPQVDTELRIARLRKSWAWAHAWSSAQVVGDPECGCLPEIQCVSCWAVQQNGNEISSDFGKDSRQGDRWYRWGCFRVTLSMDFIVSSLQGQATHRSGNSDSPGARGTWRRTRRMASPTHSWNECHWMSSNPQKSQRGMMEVKRCFKMLKVFEV